MKEEMSELLSPCHPLFSGNPLTDRIPEPDGFIVCARCEKFRIVGEGD